MNQKYTLTVADIEINVISDESPEALVLLDIMLPQKDGWQVCREIREISSKSRNCSKTEAAILCSLDYCADKIRAQRKVKSVEAKLAHTEAAMDELIAENEALKEELEALKKDR